MRILNEVLRDIFVCEHVFMVLINLIVGFDIVFENKMAIIIIIELNNEYGISFAGTHIFH